ALAAAYEIAIGGNSDVEGVCYTSQVGRAHFNHRLAIVGGSGEELVPGLRKCEPDQPGEGGAADAAGRAPRLAFLFTGEGPVNLGVGRELYDTVPAFRATVDTCDRVLQAHAGVGLREALFANTPPP